MEPGDRPHSCRGKRQEAQGLRAGSGVSVRPSLGQSRGRHRLRGTVRRKPAGSCCGRRDPKQGPRESRRTRPSHRGLCCRGGRLCRVQAWRCAGYGQGVGAQPSPREADARRGPCCLSQGRRFATTPPGQPHRPVASCPPTVTLGALVSAGCRDLAANPPSARPSTTVHNTPSQGRVLSRWGAGSWCSFRTLRNPGHVSCHKTGAWGPFSPSPWG